MKHQLHRLGFTSISVAALVVSLAAVDRIAALAGAAQRAVDARTRDDGQATAEYALVLLGAAAVALAIVSWASRTNAIGRLLDVVFGGLLKKAG